MVGANCVGGSAVVTESSMFVSSVLSISIPGGCNNLGLVVGAIGDGGDVVSADVVVVTVDVIEAVEVVVSVFSMVLDSVVSSVVVSVVVVASVVVVVS